MRSTRLHALTMLVPLALAFMLHGAPARAEEDDPDLPGQGTPGSVPLDKDEYLQLRDAHVARLRGLPSDVADNPRLKAIQEMTARTRRMMPFTSSTAWTPIGPAPIPNGQTTLTSVAVSGRVSAIAVHPSNPNIVYVGAAQGGVYRTLDGGATWTPIFDAAASLSVGALALAPSNPSILYVGTGEANGSLDCFFGVGLYRIDNADTAPVLNGPFDPTPTTDVIGAKTFTGRSISRILVDHADPAIIFVSTASGVGGAGGDALGSSPPVTALRGIYRSTNATSASPAFAKLTVLNQGSIAPDVTGNRIVNDMLYDPTDTTGNTLVCWVYGNATAGDGGVWRTTNALAAAPVFTQAFVTTVGSARGAFAANRVGGVTTMLVATGEAATGTGCTTGSGCLRRSTDGGATWSGKLTGGGGFCGGQCWYDIVVALHPAGSSIILIGGGGNGTCSRDLARSTNAGASFSSGGGSDVGLHADAHAIVFAPSNPSIVYEGSDGGIFRSNDAGATWTSLNGSGFSATQFQSLAVHPRDPDFTLGGTQDNGTNLCHPAGAWNQVDWGDGGFAQIDQNSTDSSDVVMYHTYYSQQNSQMGYARVAGLANATRGNWSFFGNGGNGILLAEQTNFYAPLVLGPGSPNTVYYATDRLHRSADMGSTNPVVSQAPIVSGVPISAVAISLRDDNVRLVGLNNGQVWGTVSGSSTLVNYTGALPSKYVGRIAFDPTDANVAYVSFCGFGLAGGQHVWKTTNLLTGSPTWQVAGNGIPDVPVNALVVDPGNHNTVFAGTDIGVYLSGDGGSTWLPFNTGLPVVAVFDMAVQSTSRTLRLATHGRGIWERGLSATTPVLSTVLGAEFEGGRVKLVWSVPGSDGRALSVYRRPVPGDWAPLAQVLPGSAGQIEYADAAVAAGRSYEYALGQPGAPAPELFGQVWVDVPAGAVAGLQGVFPNPTRGAFTVNFALPEASPASLEVLDVAGRVVASAPLAGLGAGPHQVEMSRAGGMGAGVYFVRLTQAGRTSTRRVVVVK